MEGAFAGVATFGATGVDAFAAAGAFGAVVGVVGIGMFIGMLIFDPAHAP